MEYTIHAELLCSSYNIIIVGFIISGELLEPLHCWISQILLMKLHSLHAQLPQEFCKLSGLLCSYGLYQVVCHEQLVLYCRGNTASFSARVMATDTTGKCMSSHEHAHDCISIVTHAVQLKVTHATPCSKSH